MIIKSLRIISFIFLAISTSTLLLWGNDPIDRLWERDIKGIKKTLRKQTLHFTPRSSPDYKNKILDFVYNMDSTIDSRVVIIREKTNPEKDYVFIKNKLYSILESHGSLNDTKESTLRKSLKNRFGAPKISKKDNCTIHSYNNRKTKILYYSCQTKMKTRKCDVYYYTRRLFGMLFEL